MLVIQIPDSGDRKRKLRALAYLIPGPLIIWAAFTAAGDWFYLAIAVEIWWLWAVWTDPGMKR